jgi:hypothetical protein
VRTPEHSSQAIALIEAYGSAFTRLDLDAIADLFAYALHITGDDERITPAAIASREEWPGQLRRLLRAYRTMGFAAANMVDLSVIVLSPRLFQAAVQWDLRDRTGASLDDFTAIYTLAEVGGALRITAPPAARSR